MFKTATGLRELYPRLLSHSTLCFGAEEVMNFLGRKLTGRFEGEVVSDLSSFACRRVGGSRSKHRVKQNWMKMYDKAGLVLRVETVINNPQEFRVRKQVLRDGRQRAEWVALRKGVAYLFRYREVSLQANARYLDALAAVDDPTPGKQALQRLTSTKKDAAGRSCPGNNADGATRRHLVQERDGRRALPARLHQPRHPIAADRHTLATRLCRRPEESQCQGRPLLQAAACLCPHRQDPAHPTLADL